MSRDHFTRNFTTLALIATVLTVPAVPSATASTPSPRAALQQLVTLDRDVIFHLDIEGEWPVTLEIANRSRYRTIDPEFTEVIAGTRYHQSLTRLELARANAAGFPSVRWTVSTIPDNRRAPSIKEYLPDIDAVLEHGTVTRRGADLVASFDLSKLPDEEILEYLPIVAATYRIQMDRKGRVLSIIGTQRLYGPELDTRSVSLRVRYTKPSIPTPPQRTTIDGDVVAALPAADLTLEAALETARGATLDAARRHAAVGIDDLENAARPLFSPSGMVAFYTATGLRYTNGTAAWCIDTAPAGTPVPVRSCAP